MNMNMVFFFLWFLEMMSYYLVVFEFLDIMLVWESKECVNVE